MKRIIAALIAVIALLPLCAFAETGAGDLDSIKAHVKSCAENLDDEITFYYDANLDDVFGAWENLETMLYNAGVAVWTAERDTDARSIRVYDITYRQGLAIASAHLKGDTSGLGGEERTMLDKALSISEAAIAECATDLDLTVYLHDAICAMAVYDRSDNVDGEDIYTVNDTAVGVIQYGRGECDAYADAFYLLGTLAGLDVGYQYGVGGGETHLWNTVRVGGSWYMTDVTWDDPDLEYDAGMTSYRYLNVGSANMFDHQWNREMSLVNVCEKTNEDVFTYTRQGTGKVAKNLDDAAEYAADMLKNGEKRVHVLAKVEGAAWSDLSSKITSELNARGVRATWYVWAYKYRAHTCFDIWFK